MSSSEPQIESRKRRVRLQVPQRLSSVIANSGRQWLLLPRDGFPKDIRPSDRVWIAEHCAVKTTPGRLPDTFNAEILYSDCSMRVTDDLANEDIKKLPLGMLCGLPARHMREWMARTEICVLRVSEHRLADVPDDHEAVKGICPYVPEAMNVGLLDGSGPSLMPPHCNTMRLRKWLLRVYWEAEYGHSSQAWARNPIVVAVLIAVVKNRCKPQRRDESHFLR